MKDELLKRQSNSIERAISINLFEKWIEFLDVSPKTISTYKRSMRQFMRWIIENDISQPTRDDILNYKQSLQERLKPATAQAYLTSVKLFFKWTDQEGLYPNVADHVKGVKVSKGHKKDYLTSGQVKQILG